MFDLEAPSVPLTAPAVYPAPVILEKLYPRASLARWNTPLGQDINVPVNIWDPSIPASFEERMDTAMFYARRATKKKKLAEKVRESLEREDQPDQIYSVQDSSRVVSSTSMAHVPSKGLSKQQTGKPAVPKRARDARPSANLKKPGLPKTPARKHVGRSSTVDANKVLKLQERLDEYVQRIRDFDYKSDEIVEEEDLIRRRKLRQAAEQATASVRCLYNLQQQAHKIHEDINRASHAQDQENFVNRLFFVYQAAARTLETFVRHAGYLKIADRERVFRELGHLLRQLSTCCDQLDVGDDQSPSSNNLQILKTALASDNFDTRLQSENELITRRTSKSDARPSSHNVVRFDISPTRKPKTGKLLRNLEAPKVRQDRVRPTAGRPRSLLKSQPASHSRSSAVPMGRRRTPLASTPVPKTRKPKEEHVEDHTDVVKMETKPAVDVNRLIQEIEHRLRDVLNPLLADAKNIAEQHAAIYRNTAQSLRHNLSERVTQTVEQSSDVLTGAILNDLLTDTAQELLRFSALKEADKNANMLAMQPDLETILQTLDKMEKERDEMRHKWTSLVYDEPNIGINVPRQTDTHGMEDETMFGKENYHDSIFARASRLNHHGESEAIKKPILPVCDMSHASQLGTKHQMKHITKRSPKIDITVPKKRLDSINSYRERFNGFLKHSSLYGGRYDKKFSHMIDGLASEVLDNALTDVAKNLDEILADCTEEVYDEEFVEPSKAQAQSLRRTVIISK